MACSVTGNYYTNMFIFLIYTWTVSIFCMHVIHNVYIVVSPQLLSPASRSLKSMYGDIAPQIIDLIDALQYRI